MPQAATEPCHCGTTRLRCAPQRQQQHRNNTYEKFDALIGLVFLLASTASGCADAAQETKFFHVVAFKFKEGTTKEQTAEKAFKA